MKILLLVDSREANTAAVGLLDPHTGEWEKLQLMALPEPFVRRGFRGVARRENTLYAVNSAALYRLELDLRPGKPEFVSVEHTLRRPEWEVGERAAADLHHVHYSPSRKTLLIANSFMDAVDEVSLEGKLLERRYLWDISQEVAEVALQRDTKALDLVHINHISERDGIIYLTLGNWNGTRKGRVIRFDTGETVIDGLEFPHDGVFENGDLYLTESAAERIAVVRNFPNGKGSPRQPDQRFEVAIPEGPWQGSFQWVRGLAFTQRHVLCGVTQWRKGSAERPQIPPRIAFFRRGDMAPLGDLFLPPIEGAPTPALFSVHVVEDERGEDLPYERWAVPAPPEALRPTPAPPVPPAPAELREALGLPLEFAASGERTLSREWHYPRWLQRWRLEAGFGVEPRFCLALRADGALKVWSTQEAKQSFHLRTGKGGYQKPPANPEVWQVREATSYEIETGVTKRSGPLKVLLYVAEYGAGKLIRKSEYRVERGKQKFPLRTEKGTRAVRFGFCFVNHGQVTVRPLQLFLR